MGLVAVAGSAAAPGLPEPVVDPAEVQRTAEEIVSRPEFADAGPGPVERALGRVAEWLLDLLDRVWPDVVPGPGSGGSAALTWLFVAVGLGALVFFAHRLWRDRRLKVRRPGSDGLTIEIDPDDDTDWDRDAARLEELGAWREAMLSRYRSLAVRLARAGVVEPGRARTTGEHRRSVAERLPGAADAMADVTASLEAVHYGAAPADEATVRSFRQRADDVAAQLGTTVR